MRNWFLKTAASLLICVIISAVLIGIYSDYLKPASQQHTFSDYLSAIYTAFFVILLYGLWLLYIPAMGLFNFIAGQLKEHPSGFYYILLGFVIGAIYAFPVVMLVIGPSIGLPWYQALHFGLVGALYGLLYRYWISRSSNQGLT